MAVRLHNTLSRRLEPLKPLRGGEVRVYTCGPTAYDYAHIGNLRTFIFEDLLKRTLLDAGHSVRHVMNITDVDDKTIQRATEEGRPLKELTEHYTDAFEADLAALNILPADQLPRATSFIPQIVSAIERLLSKKHAYLADDGSVYFDIASFGEYGRLARLEPDKLVSTERVAQDDYEKRQARDFALWKARKEADGAFYWPSPWGEGRPGWHMECTVMSTHYLGDHFDIHCGGVDNIFPHHENEIAQSRCLFGTPFVNLWLHSEHLIVEGQKMSKSLGNMYRLSDVVAKGHTPEAVRYTLLATHYRKKLNFTFAKVRESQKAINRLRELARRLEQVGQAGLDGRQSTDLAGPPLEAFQAALQDDLNISAALGAMFGWVKTVFAALDHQDFAPQAALEALEALHRFDQILGFIFAPQPRDEEVEDLIVQRNAARENRDWDRADAIRDQLLMRGIILEDTPEGTIWKKT